MAKAERFTLSLRRSTIRNVKSIHNQIRKRISQETYRRNSMKYRKMKMQSNLQNKSNTISKFQSDVPTRLKARVMYGRG